MLEETKEKSPNVRQHVLHACNAYTQTAIYDADYRKLAPKVTKKKDLTQPSLKKLSSFFFKGVIT